LESRVRQAIKCAFDEGVDRREWLLPMMKSHCRWPAQIGRWPGTPVVSGEHRRLKSGPSALPVLVR
jgi:hypothetical protein